MEQTFLVQQKLIDGTWYQCSEHTLLLNALSWLQRCEDAHPDREYRLASRTVTIEALVL